jgi:hypothetical protein
MPPESFRILLKSYRIYTLFSPYKTEDPFRYDELFVGKVESVNLEGLRIEDNLWDKL